MCMEVVGACMKWSVDGMRVGGFEGARPIRGYCHIQRQSIQAAEYSEAHIHLRSACTQMGAAHDENHAMIIHGVI